MVFTGFSTNKLIGLPPEFFTEVLPYITLPTELKVTLHIFYCLSRKQGHPRSITWDELIDDRELCQSLRALSQLRSPKELLDEGLEAAVRRTTLLHVTQPGEGRLINWYLVNTPMNRTWIEQIKQQRFTLETHPMSRETRSSLLTLYEQNIGLITPMMIDELREAEERYPSEWIEEAIREAVRSNIRSWRYVRKILERWSSHGKQHEKNPFARNQSFDIEKYTNGTFGGLFRLGSDNSDL